MNWRFSIQCSACDDLSPTWISFSLNILEGDPSVKSFCLPSLSYCQEKGISSLLPKRSIPPQNSTVKDKANIQSSSSKTENIVTYANKGQA